MQRRDALLTLAGGTRRVDEIEDIFRPLLRNPRSVRAASPVPQFAGTR